MSSKGNGPRNSRLASKRIKQDEEIDFDEIEKKAKQEAEEAKKLGYKPTESVSNATVATDSPRKASVASSLSLKKDNDEVKLTPAPVQETTQQFQKLGFGMTQGTT